MYSRVNSSTYDVNSSPRCSYINFLRQNKTTSVNHLLDLHQCSLVFMCSTVFQCVQWCSRGWREVGTNFWTDFPLNCRISNPFHDEWPHNVSESPEIAAEGRYEEKTTPDHQRRMFSAVWSKNRPSRIQNCPHRGDLPRGGENSPLDFTPSRSGP